MKPTICKHCGAINKHFSFQCHAKRQPIKVNIVTTEWKDKNVKAKKARKKKSGTEKHGSLEELKKVAVMVFNKFIRERDCVGESFSCISCGEFKSKRLAQAGHYMPSTYSELKFNEHNVHAECLQCNCIDSNHLVGYRKNLINKIGIEKVEWLESHNIANTKKWDRQELLDIISKYK